MSGPASVGPARRRRRRLAAGLAALAAGALLGPGAGVARAVPFCPQWAGFSPANFPQQPHIDNALLPLVPGAQRILDGRSNVNGQPLAHRVTFTVTNLTKVIDGVRTVVVHDVDYSSGQLAESELSFWAQDVFGTVWNIGEYPEEYANGKMEGAPLTWLAGVDGAVPGIHAPWQTPPVGGQRYNQGWSPTIQFLGCAQTIGVGLTRCVPAGCFDGIVATDETSPLDPASGHQRKYYAPGVGIVQIGAINDPQGETLVLTSASQLDADALAAVDAVSLEQERRAHADRHRPVRGRRRQRAHGPRAARRAGGARPPPRRAHAGHRPRARDRRQRRVRGRADVAHAGREPLALTGASARRPAGDLARTHLSAGGRLAPCLRRVEIS